MIGRSLQAASRITPKMCFFGLPYFAIRLAFGYIDANVATILQNPNSEERFPFLGVVST